MRLFNLFFSLLFILSCSSKDKKFENPLLDFEEAGYIASFSLMSSDSLFKANDILLLDDFLIINDPELDYIFKVINVSNDKFVQKFGRRGEGPCELSPLSFINPIRANETSIGIYNGSNQSYQQYYLTDILETSPMADCDPENFDFETFHLNYTKLSGDYGLGYGFYDEPFVLIHDSRIVQHLGEFPFQERSQGAPSARLAMAHQPRLLKPRF